MECFRFKIFCVIGASLIEVTQSASFLVFATVVKLILFWVSAASGMFFVSAIRAVVNSGVVGILYLFFY